MEALATQTSALAVAASFPITPWSKEQVSSRAPFPVLITLITRRITFSISFNITTTTAVTCITLTAALTLASANLAVLC